MFIVLARLKLEELKFEIVSTVRAGRVECPAQAVSRCLSVSEMSDNLATTLPTTVNQDIVAVRVLLGVLLRVLLVVGYFSLT